MSLALQHYKTTKHLLFFAFGMLLCVYFMYHSFHGNRSLPKLMQLEHAAVLLQKDLSALQQERKVLEGRVVMMRP
ncbi:MAG: FtsB family cell division protein, partial [Alphaproteobacteria bacterium]